MYDQIPIFWIWLRKLCLIFAFLSGVAMLLMMSIGALDIITTFIFSRPIPATFEFIETMIVVVAFFAIPLAQSRRAHIRVELLYNFMPKPLKFSSDLLGFLLSAIFYALIANYGWRAVVISFDQNEIVPGIINFPLWPARFALFVGAMMMTIQCLGDLIGLLLGQRELHTQSSGLLGEDKDSD
ncbi:MAG: TRAP transporter small permease [Paracoccaceae bacterium]|nr:TRAP transporter small permease [Paracoccaceae bacterium]|tara:strand:- start:278 stop:826 length:549 start_codon:yes stop_codon:yes gene_type:complete